MSCSRTSARRRCLPASELDSQHSTWERERAVYAHAATGRSLFEKLAREGGEGLKNLSARRESVLPSVDAWTRDERDPGGFAPADPPRLRSWGPVAPLPPPLKLRRGSPKRLRREGGRSGGARLWRA